MPLVRTTPAAVESLGVNLTTGASQVSTFDIADDKISFAKAMLAHGLPVVPSIRITDANTLEYLLQASPFPGCRLCAKPVTGIYGMGFWLLDDRSLSTDIINHPEQRRIHRNSILPQSRQRYLYSASTHALVTWARILRRYPAQSWQSAVRHWAA